MFHSFMAGFDYKSFQQNTLLTGSDSDQTPITYVPFVVQYDGSRKWDSGATSWNVGSVFHIRGVGDEEDIWQRKRAEARSDFIYWTAELKHRQELPGEFQLLGRVNGQLTSAPLISNEQFSLGGTQTVRGYHETELLGDDGYNASLELYSPRLTPPGWESVQNLRFLAFGDYGATWIRQALPDEPESLELASAGAGLRFQFLKHMVGEFDWAYPFLATNDTSAGAQRIHFKLAYEF
jgi:hemolysin activation/secretion protein